MKLASVLLVCLLAGACLGGVAHRPNDGVENNLANALEARGRLALLFGDNQYVTGVFVTTLKVENQTHPINLLDGEVWADFCLHVQLNVNLGTLPPALQRMQSFSSFRVFFQTGVSVHLDDDSSSASEENKEGVMCTADMGQCPDGSWASRKPPTCALDCPVGLPTGNLTYHEVTRIAHEYFAQFSNQNNFVLHINTLDQEDLEEEMPLTSSESLSDYCIDVVFMQQPDQTVPTPTVYQGVRIFYWIETCVDCDIDGDSMFFSWTIFFPIFIVISMIACCCRRRRRKCCQKNSFQPLRPAVDEQQELEENLYPAQQYEYSEQPMVIPVPPMQSQMMMQHPHMMPFMPPQHPFMMPQHPGMMNQHPMFSPMMATPNGYVMMMQPPTPLAPPQQEENTTQ